MPRNSMQPAAVLDDILGHKAIETIDAVFVVGSRSAEVLVTGATGRARWIRTRKAHRTDDQVSGSKIPHVGANLTHLTQRLMPKNEVVAAGRRRTENEGAE